MSKRSFIIISISGLVFALPAKAICPVCTIAVGAGIGLSRWIGIDDSITGIWIGALVVSLTLWTITWMKGKKWSFKFMEPVMFLVFVALTILPLFWMDIFFHPFNKLWGVDKLILGMIVGVLAFMVSAKLHFFLKERNDNRVYFPFQKVVMTVGTLVILSGAFYLITKY